MANSLSAGIAAIIAAKGAPVLRKRAIMPRYVNTDWNNDVAQQGDTIQVQVSATKSVSDVSPGAVPPTPSDTTITQVPIVLSSWKKADFHLTSKQAHELMRQETYVTQEMEEAFAAIANQVNADLFSLYTKVYGYAGTAGTTPFASDTTAATSVRKILNKQLAPPDNRSLIIDPDAEALALNLPAFQYVQNAGDNSVIREGALGRRLGFDIDSTTTVPTHTAGTISDGSGRTMKVNNSGGYAAGTTSLNFNNTTLTGTLVVGDVLTFTGHSQSYVVTAAATASSNAFTGVTISPALQASVANTEVATVKASHVVNLGFHRQAFALAVRPLAFDPAMMPAGTVSQNYVDPVSALPFRVDVIPGYEQMTVEVKVLYGYACIRPELACRLAG